MVITKHPNKNGAVESSQESIGALVATEIKDKQSPLGLRGPLD
jgi:hypothetical protein